MADLTIRSVDHDTWTDFEALFESKGAPKYCWCMAWRPMPNRSKANNAKRKAAIRASVSDETPVGILGYRDGAPIAWCSIGPRETFISLVPAQDETEAGVWSLTCFFVLRAHRKQGLSEQLLDGAIRYARDSGAKVLEAYPVDPDSPSYRFMGFRSLFEARGFEDVGRAGTRRHVVRLTL